MKSLEDHSAETDKLLEEADLKLQAVLGKAEEADHRREFREIQEAVQYLRTVLAFSRERFRDETYLNTE